MSTVKLFYASNRAADIRQSVDGEAADSARRARQPTRALPNVWKLLP